MWLVAKTWSKLYVYEELTLEKLNKLTKKNYSEEEGEKTVDAIKQLCHILLKFMMEQEIKVIE